jgi:hypothetical protein
LETLFGHLATRFAPSPENIAIEALGFILARSTAARRAFTGIASTGGVLLPLDLEFATQAADDDLARPDIEAYSPDGKRHCVIECKFWAGLTSNQPLTYAARLTGDLPGVLVFIVPSARLGSLFAELVKRLRDGGLEVGKRRESQQEVWHTSFGVGHSLVVSSWRAVLTSIQREMEMAHQSDRIEDVRQLVGLCERMDTEAFIPFRSDELTSLEAPRRYLQFGQLALDIGQALLDSGLCDRKGLTAAHGHGYSGRFLRAGQIVFFISFDCWAWATHKLSPLWLRFSTDTPPQVLAAIRGSAELRASRNLIEETDRHLRIPLHIEAGSERPDLISAAVDEIAALLAQIESILGAHPSEEVTI